MPNFSHLYGYHQTEITFREVVFSALIIGLMTFIGFLISGYIEKTVSDKQLKYRQAVELTSDEEFSHAMRTDVGNAFAEGKFETIEPVSYEHLKGSYLSIHVRYQHYTHHTRVVTYTVKVGKSTRVRTRIEHYWTWDTVRTDSRSAKKVIYCGNEFPKDKFNYGCVRKGSYIHRVDSDDRMVFEYYPEKFTASVFSNFGNNTISDGTALHEDMSVAKLREYLTTSHAVGLFWMCWIFFMILAVIGFVSIENDWLED